MSIKLKVLGGGLEVGRSGFLIDSGDKVILDYGIKLTPKGTEYPLLPNGKIDAAIISHAHLDHSGQLPHLFKDSRFLSYMTSPTLEIAKILWHDSLHIAGMEGIDASFSKQEIIRTERFTFAVNYKKDINITDNIKLQFSDAGHILGSAIVKLTVGDKILVYTGDFKEEETRLHSGADLSKIKKCDYLIIESTYGDRDHPPRKELEKRFVEDIQDVLDRGGIALISAFAVGRSQEIADILYEYRLDTDIYFDGMCQEAAITYIKNPNFLRKPKFLKKALERLIWVKNLKMRKAALKKPCVIITTSGMLQGGPVQFYLRELYNDKNSKLFLTGYQVKDTPGRILLDSGKINIDGIMVEPKIGYEKYDFSAHAGRKELLSIINRLDPEKVILVHGDSEVIEKFGKDLEEDGFETYNPNIGEEIIL
ncbi:MAG: MBL fold metallo-hydrolase [Candidatus Diapherotrites archaeon]|nr:MBL fold metallo-hydrolase [Candidatus Diapherotrites archaeon]